MGILHGTTDGTCPVPTKRNLASQGQTKQVSRDLCDDGHEASCHYERVHMRCSHDNRGRANGTMAGRMYPSPTYTPAKTGGSRTTPTKPLRKARFILLFGCYGYGCASTGCSCDVQEVVPTGLVRGWLLAVCPGGYGAQATVPVDRRRADGQED